MFILEVESAPEYLVEQHVIADPSEVCVSLLTGGVSNRVLLVEFADRNRANWVLKQARDRLAVEQEWLCSVERVIREMDTLQICNELIQAASAPSNGVQAVVPAIHFEDRENYVYAMTAAAVDCRVWKRDLLDGVVDQAVAKACGWMLGVLHSGSWNAKAIRDLIGSTEFFDDLRLDPYYRQITRVHPELQAPVSRLLESNINHRNCLVHGDYSPKNILVNDKFVVLLDFEVGHFGDPAFDLGFFLTHLHIKALIAGNRFDEYASLIDVFWNAYVEEISKVLSKQEFVALEQRSCLNLGACLVARVDGKSPVEYLVDDSIKALVRNVGWQVLVGEVGGLEAVREVMRIQLSKE